MGFATHTPLKDEDALMKQTWRLLFHKPLTSSFLSTSSSVLGKQRSYSALTQHCSKYCQIAVSSHRESKTFPDHLQPQASRLRWMPLIRVLTGDSWLSLERLPGPGLLALRSTPALCLTILPSPPSNPSQICMIRCVKILPPTPHPAGPSLQPLIPVLRVSGMTLRSQGLTSFWGRMTTVWYSGQASTSTSRLNGFLFLMWKRAPYTYTSNNKAAEDDVSLWDRVLPVAQEVKAGVRRTWWGTSLIVQGLRLPPPPVQGAQVWSLVRGLDPTWRS